VLLPKTQGGTPVLIFVPRVYDWESDWGVLLGELDCLRQSESPVETSVLGYSLRQWPFVAFGPLLSLRLLRASNASPAAASERLERQFTSGRRRVTLLGRRLVTHLCLGAPVLNVNNSSVRQDLQMLHASGGV
jgi:hypothetical protein